MVEPPRAPTLVVLAAGLGSRYRGLKQLEAVGPGGETLMDYAVYDARRAGFGDVVFIIRPQMQELFEPMMRSRFGGIPARYVLQKMDDLPPGFTAPANRTRPWGTGQAVLAAERTIDGPFAVVNADDFYGAEAYQAIGRFLSGLRGDEATWAIVGYRLENTISPVGGVNRAVCRTSGDRLASLEEVLDIVALPGGRYSGRGRNGPVTLDGDALVSMNMWGFTRALTPVLEQGFATFLRQADIERDEFILPEAVQGAIKAGTANVVMLSTGARWIGMTHAADHPAVTAALAALVAQGQYPEKLW